MKLKPKSLPVCAVVFAIYFREIVSVIYSKPFQSLDNLKVHDHDSKGLVPKVSLTQKGYIQFLRYVVDVPEITEYTICIWVRSNNFTYNHPLLSYSKNENKRLIRVWITPSGSHINLEILERPIFSIPAHLLMNEWYHICQSWSSINAAWALYLNRNLKASGYAPKLRKIAIESGGDIVVGQEYTDFDKGLDDGIEGDISGFNFILASTFSDPHKRTLINHIPNNVFKRDIKKTDQEDMSVDPFFNSNQHFTKMMGMNSEIADKTPVKRQIWDDSLVVSTKLKLIPLLRRETQPNNRQQLLKQRRKTFYEPLTKIQSLEDKISKPLGLLLVELSNDCGYLRGAPLSGKRVLVSWTKTNVRVFGGAILKTVPPFCVKYK